MQHVDPYNDDFFKKAADDYPLRTDAGNWEDVAGKLNSFRQEEIVARVNYKNIRQKSAMICAMLLIPFAIAVTKYLNVDYKQLPETPVKDKHVEVLAAKTAKAKGVKKEVYNAGFIDNVKGINSDHIEGQKNVLLNSTLADKIE